MTVYELVKKNFIGKTIKDIPPMYCETQSYLEDGEEVPLCSGKITHVRIGWNGGEDTITIHTNNVSLDNGHVEQLFDYDFKFEDNE